MNNEHNAACPKCGAELLSTGNCLKCGYNVNTGTSVNLVSEEQVPVNQVNQGVSLTQNIETQTVPETIPLTEPIQQPVQQPVQQSVQQPIEPTIQYSQMNQPMTATQKYEHSDDGIDESEDIKRKHIVHLILAIVNMFVIYPFINAMLLGTSIFGLLEGSASGAIGSQIINGIYACFSLFALIFSIINVFIPINHRKLAKIISVVGVIAFALINNSGTKSKNYYPKSTSKIIENNMEEKVVLDNEKLKVTQKGISYDSSYVKLAFSVEEKVDNRFKCDTSMIKYRINQYNMSKNFVTPSPLEPNEKGECVLKIGRGLLSDYSISDIYQVDLWVNNTMVTFTTDSKKTDKELSILKDDQYLIYENDYFKMYYDPDYKYYIKVYLVSKVSDNYSVYFSNLDFNTPAVQSLDAFDSVTLYDYSITKAYISYHTNENNFSYLKGHYKIYNDQSKLEAEGDIDEKFDSYLAPIEKKETKN